MFSYFQKLLGEQGLAPHGFCLLWDPALIWTHVIADALIGIAYFSIPIVIARFLTQRRDVAFSWIVWMFAAFILACGATHFFSIWTLWNPDYGLEALLKLVTAAVSVFTAIAMWPLLSKAVALPSPVQLQRLNDDLTVRVAERDAALQALAEASAERERVEDMLRQAQKMEAVGQLSGGIAHDFNNLLTIVMANIDRAMRLPPGDARKTTALTSALSGAERAAKLTDQLLSFSRRQPLQPELHDLNAILSGLHDLFDATLGPSISIATDFASDLWPVQIDANQTENAVLNLVGNARDAMPSGGVLTLRTFNAPATDADAPQDHVVLEVSDTGAGMSDEVAQHAFEPFFTTKPLGQGTGLGLSQVYGFINQSHGEIGISSTPGAGTTVRICLPRADAALMPD